MRVGSRNREDVLAQAIASRIDRRSPRPVIVEGAVALRLLADIGRRPDFYIHITVADEVDVIDSEERQDVETYDAEYRPSEIADFVVHFP